MKLFARERARLFTVSTPFGVAASAVLLSAFKDELLAFSAVKLYGRWFLYPVCILPLLVAYELGYLVNRLLIRAFAAQELRLAQKRILERLVDACLSELPVLYDPTDLIEEEARTAFRRYWRAK